jgi:hypothetical protein
MGFGLGNGHGGFEIELKSGRPVRSGFRRSAKRRVRASGRQAEH